MYENPQIPGHAIWQGCDASRSTLDQDWILQDFQKDGKHVKTYLKHLTKGLSHGHSEFLFLGKADWEFPELKTQC
jgi:hypothetical protein